MRLILASFSDTGRTSQANQLAAQQQIKIVQAALTREGIVSGHIIAFGADLPTTGDTTSASQERNDKVEVYLAPQ